MPYTAHQQSVRSAMDPLAKVAVRGAVPLKDDGFSVAIELRISPDDIAEDHGVSFIPVEFIV
jgi:hypothetical protein